MHVRRTSELVSVAVVAMALVSGAVLGQPSAVKVLSASGVKGGSVTASTVGEHWRVPAMGIGLGGVSPHTSAWQFVDMMKYSREWRAPKGYEVVEDEWGWPIALKDKAGKQEAIGESREIKMWIYDRRIAGDVVLTWEGDGEVAIQRRESELTEDGYPGRKRRVYHWDNKQGGVFDLVVRRSNPDDHVRNIRMWMPGFENAESPFHPLFRRRLGPFAYFRFMDWGGTNNSEQKEWSDRRDPRDMRQKHPTAYEYMIQLSNETDRDPWICIPHMASDDYVRKLAQLLKESLEPERKVYVEYSNEIWNGSFRQTRWLWDLAEAEIKAKSLKDSRSRPLRKWEHAPTLCGRRSAQIWAIMEKVLDDPDRIIRTITHFRWLDKAIEAAKDPANGTGRVDLIALNGYFISQDALQYTLRNLDQFDIDRTLDDIEQLHLLDKAVSWAREIQRAKEKWGLPITCYEGGQHFANPFSRGLQGKELVKRMFEVNAHPQIRKIYRTALETWRLAGGDGFTPFVDCGSWSKYGCWGHLQYHEQPLADVVDPDTGEVVEKAAYKYLALLDYIERFRDQDPTRSPRIVTAALADAAVGQAYECRLRAEGGKPPYRWSLLGGRLPRGLSLREDGVIVGTPEKPEQLVCITNVADSAGQHGSEVFGLFIDPAAGADLRAETFAAGRLPEGWACQGDGKPQFVESGPVESPTKTSFFTGRCRPYVLASSTAQGYTVEMVCTPRRVLSIHYRIGFAVDLTPDGDPEDFLRVVIDGPGRKASAYSRYLKGSRNELWRPRECPLIPDEGEGEDSPAIDQGEFWTIRVTKRPASSPGAIDLLVSVFDEQGRPRLDPSGRNDVANGIWLLRELALKDALRSGPFGLIPEHVLVDRVSWTISEARPAQN